MWTAIRNPEAMERKIVKVYEIEGKLKNNYIVVISRVLGDLFVFCFNAQGVFLTYFCTKTWFNFFLHKSWLL